MVSADTADSVYAPASRIWRYGLKSGQKLSVTVAPPWHESGHPVMMMVQTVDGEEFDYGELFQPAVGHGDFSYSSSASTSYWHSFY
ncbi:MAG: hypothetical protein L6V35_00260 [Alistipes putredinis]|nr:MAG: hypothetical protein L6V35_00260 [Alistipes putredinis]